MTSAAAVDPEDALDPPGADGRRTSRGRSALLRARGASGAVVAQLAQAAASLLLQVVALRSLGAEGLGVFALVYSVLVLLTALSSGLVGDSLTVLDRRRPGVRSALLVLAVAAAATSAVATGVVAVTTSLFSPAEALVVALAVGAFLLEDLGRRWLMAGLRFWRVVVVDLTSLLVAVGWLLLVARADGVVLVDLFAALAAGQVAGLLAVALLLPADERGSLLRRAPQLGVVLRFGVWRAAQQGVRPATLTLVRVLVVAVVGAATFGQLEAARVYTAPAMLLLNGAAGFLFASYAARQGHRLDRLLRSADRGAGLLVATSLVAGVVAVLAAPVLGPVLTGGAFPLDLLAVAGWCAYAAAAAMLMPYASLAAVRGRHVAVLVLRVGELVVSLGLAASLLLFWDLGAAWVPLALALGAAVSAVVSRQVLLVPLVSADVRSRSTCGAGPGA